MNNIFFCTHTENWLIRDLHPFPQRTPTMTTTQLPSRSLSGVNLSEQTWNRPGNRTEIPLDSCIPDNAADHGRVELFRFIFRGIQQIHTNSSCSCKGLVSFPIRFPSVSLFPGYCSPKNILHQIATPETLGEITTDQ